MARLAACLEGLDDEHAAAAAGAREGERLRLISLAWLVRFGRSIGSGWGDVQELTHVLDRFGAPLVALRDRFAGIGAYNIATGKAWTAVNFTRDTSDFVKAVKDGTLSAGLASLPNVTPLAGGMVIEASGSLLGGVGVAGAPGGDKDEACVKAGIDKIADQLK